MKQPIWLPPLVLLNDYGGNSEAYLEAVYTIFKGDFIDSKPSFKGIRFGLKRYPLLQDKEATFWHITSEGSQETERIPDFRRCERIRWLRPIIENSEDPAIKVWENDRKGNKRICLWLDSEDYLVILDKRDRYVLLWTAYLVTQPHRQRKLQKEYEAYKMADAAD
ncbi:hypothetical protein [Dolichospermum flos-aquae]|jgi:hypothetical protein|uniref:Phage P1-related protein n=1 Tax=Dolichospermum flos-aquae CCAP 1403/13F TaxID=315271 RepID=A0A6H2BVG0_DOLFA|nr:hypothetical protein [Dolichospermum flos-aquae]QJB42956.1 hypothetical protein HGD76_00570 [Dolichospermum flos-aquae CCAP 1403/13F]